MIGKIDIKGILAAVASRSCLLDAYAFFRRMFTKSQVIIVIYHRISPKQDNWSYEPLDPRSFEGQIRYFSQNFKILQLDNLIEYLVQRRPFPRKAVIITFDDGYKDNYRYAYPILKKYHVPATIFLATGHIGTGDLFWFDKVRYIIRHTNLSQLKLDELGCYPIKSEFERTQAYLIINEKLKHMSRKNRDYLIEKLLSISGVKIPADLGRDLILSWEDIKEMSHNGIAFGAHTVSHAILTNLPLHQARREIITSKKDIEARLGLKVTAFSYPNGDHNEEIVKLLKESNFECAVAVLPSKLISPKDSIYELSRIIMNEDFDKSKVVFSGLWADLKAVFKI